MSNIDYFNRGEGSSRPSFAGQRANQERPDTSGSADFNLNPEAASFHGANGSAAADKPQALAGPNSSASNAAVLKDHHVSNGSDTAVPNGNRVRNGSNTASTNPLLPINPPVPNYSEPKRSETEKTLSVEYLIFIARCSPEFNEAEFCKQQVFAPHTSKTAKGAPPVSLHTKVRTDQQMFYEYLDHFNAAMFQKRQRTCSICNNVTPTYFSHFKALYEFEKIPGTGSVNAQREGLFRPMCHVIPVCNGACLERLTSKSRREDMDNSFLDIFGRYDDFRHENQARECVIFELSREKSKKVLTWCGVCRERWYAIAGGIYNVEADRFRDHWNKPEYCKKFSRERQRSRAGSTAGSGTVTQNDNTMTPPALSSDLPAAGPSNTGNPTMFESADHGHFCFAGRSNISDEPSTSHTEQVSHNQRLPSPDRNFLRDNIPQGTQSAQEHRPELHTSANTSGNTSTASTSAVSLGGIHPTGRVKASVQVVQQEGQLRQRMNVVRNKMETVKGTFGRRAGQDVNENEHQVVENVERGNGYQVRENVERRKGLGKFFPWSDNRS